MLALLLACTAPSTTDDTAGGDTATTDPLAYLHGTAELAEPSAGSCPTISDSGDVTITSRGLERTFKVLLPESGGVGKGVVFAWYPLGGSAQWMVNTLELRDFADVADSVVIVPTASGEEAFEWAFMREPDDNNDLVLYDDVRACLYDQLQVDLGKVSAMGFSAGALWTSYLSLFRGDSLATILTFSGGTGDPVHEYVTPASDFPAFLNYGGDTDLYGGGLVDFQATTTDFATNLSADGHFVITCNHELGHTIPPEGRDMMDAWLPAHRYGEPSPFVGGDLSAFPDYCSVFGN